MTATIMPDEAMSLVHCPLVRAGLYTRVVNCTGFSSSCLCVFPAQELGEGTEAVTCLWLKVLSMNDC